MSDKVQRGGPLSPRSKVGVTAFAAEVGQVDQGHSVGRADSKDGAGRKGHQPLARAQHRKRAKEPFAVQHIIPVIHQRHLAGRGAAGKVTRQPRGVAGHVTRRPRGCDALRG